MGPLALCIGPALGALRFVIGGRFWAAIGGHFTSKRAPNINTGGWPRMHTNRESETLLSNKT
jgi:hypothetical protein